jgi:hypothetical protein
LIHKYLIFGMFLAHSDIVMNRDVKQATMARAIGGNDK